MKYLFLAIVLSATCAFAEIPKPTDKQTEVFTTICYDWLSENWQTVKKFEDGEVLFQPIHRMELVRVENDIVVLTGGYFVETDTEIYHIAIYFKANYLEEGMKRDMFQILYLHIRNGKVLEWETNKAVPYNQL